MVQDFQLFISVQANKVFYLDDNWGYSRHLYFFNNSDICLSFLQLNYNDHIGFKECWWKFAIWFRDYYFTELYINSRRPWRLGKFFSTLNSNICNILVLYSHSFVEYVNSNNVRFLWEGNGKPSSSRLQIACINASWNGRDHQFLVLEI